MPPYEFQFKTNLLKDGTVLAVGDSFSTEIFDKILMGPSNQGEGIALREFDKGEWKIYVMGRITYRDDADRERFVFFCRERQDDGRFIPVKDDDYESED